MWPLLSPRAALAFRVLVLALLCVLAFSTRLFSVLRYESVIHDYDPYFNLRATKFLVREGWSKFVDWFDASSWYPLGRAVGTTTYPGLMLTAALAHSVLERLSILVDLKDVCVMLPPAMASITVLATYALTKEVWDERAALLSAAFVSIAPGYVAHSVAGSYDNEAVAVFALVLTCCLWVKAVKRGSVGWASACSVAYLYLAGSWGGYVFLANLIPLHVLVLLLTGRFSSRLYAAYSTFYPLATVLSMQVPIIGTRALTSPEHMALLGVFLLVQVYAFLEWARSRSTDAQFKSVFRNTVRLVYLVGFAAFAAAYWTGRLSSWAGRLYALANPAYAMQHSPLLASVSENQPTAWASFYFDLHVLCFLFPAGLFFCFRQLTDQNIFVILYAVSAAYFAGVMVRLVLVLCPVACVLGGIALSVLLSSYSRVLCASAAPEKHRRSVAAAAGASGEGFELYGRHRAAAACVIGAVAVMLVFFALHSTWVTSEAYSSPSIVLSARAPDGHRIVYDDFREAYRWLAHNTPRDAVVMSWWDYGYQIAELAGRTAVVDNNMWNTTHIAVVGKAFASNETAAYETLRQLDVDYVLVVFGGLSGYGSDDVSKFLWMVRTAAQADSAIREADYGANGEYRIDSGASPAMLDSLLYKLCYYNFDKVVTDRARPAGWDRARNAEMGRKNIELEHLEEAFTTSHWLVRVYRVLPTSNRIWSK
eukprot:m51a1_g3977 putative dolichyl-diphosphooligosaccharide--protein glycosyltransferase subunit stt3a (707) ;mRNA; r:436502-439074